MNEINITLSSCKQTSAFPTELPGARLGERKWRAKSSVWISSSRDSREQAWSQNYRPDISVSDLSPHGAPGAGLVSDAEGAFNVSFECSAGNTLVPSE